MIFLNEISHLLSARKRSAMDPPPPNTPRAVFAQSQARFLVLAWAEIAEALWRSDGLASMRQLFQERCKVCKSTPPRQSSAPLTSANRHLSSCALCPSVNRSQALGSNWKTYLFYQTTIFDTYRLSTLCGNSNFCAVYASFEIVFFLALVIGVVQTS